MALFFSDWPDKGAVVHFGQCDGEFATLLWILFVKGRFGGEQVRGGADGDLLLQSAGAVPSAHQHEGVIRVRLQARDQLPLQVALHLDALLVIQDLTAGAAQVNCHTMTFILHCISISQLLHLTLKALGTCMFWHLPRKQDRGLHHNFHTKVFCELCRGGENKWVTACHRHISRLAQWYTEELHHCVTRLHWLTCCTW